MEASSALKMLRFAAWIVPAAVIVWTLAAGARRSRAGVSRAPAGDNHPNVRRLPSQKPWQALNGEIAAAAKTQNGRLPANTDGRDPAKY